jgi:hypothetical protein
MALKYNLHDYSYSPKERKITKIDLYCERKLLDVSVFVKKKSPAI